MYYQNVRGLRTKINELKVNLGTIDFDIVCFTETWLNSEFFDAEICGENFLLFRKDRNYSLSNTSRGGG